MTNQPVTAIGLAYNPVTRDWDLPVEYVARDRREAINWMKFNKDWMKSLRIKD